jgi:hypothetical protein
VEDVRILGVDSHLAEALTRRGFHTETVDPEQFALSTGIQGGPWLLIHDPAGELVYSGGYAPHQISTPAEARDLDLLARAQKGEHLDSWPALGCAASRSLKHELDPLGIKY